MMTNQIYQDLHLYIPVWPLGVKRKSSIYLSVIYDIADKVLVAYVFFR